MPLLFFLHIPKTAGSTLVEVIKRQYRSNEIYELNNSSFGEELAGLPESRREEIRAIWGHFYFGVHTYIERPSTYVTMLRDPVERVISHYYYVRRDPSHYLYEVAHNLTLEEFVASCGLAEPNNDQTRLLAGLTSSHREGYSTPEMLPAAKSNLQNHFAVVGLTEEFDKSVIAMSQTLGWRSPYYRKQNVSRQRPKKKELPTETIKTIASYNELDADLYEFSKKLLDEQVRSLGAAFEKELTTFKLRNRFYRYLHRFGNNAAVKGWTASWSQ
jgi:hypothetical protein